MKQISLDQFLTPDMLRDIAAIWNDDRANFHRRVVDEILAPDMDRINAALGQENDADYLAYAIEAALGSVQP